jgi:hypothetical protein
MTERFWVRRGLYKYARHAVLVPWTPAMLGTWVPEARLDTVPVTTSPMPIEVVVWEASKELISGFVVSGPVPSGTGPTEFIWR